MGGNQGSNPVQTTRYLDASDLGSMSDSEIMTLATERGYTITGMTHQDIIDEFMDEQKLYYEFTQSELNRLTINEITNIANARGYTITQTLKADIIQEFLDEQNG